MAKPLRSENPQPQDIQFKHFGVLSAGAQSKTSLFTSISVNVLLALMIVIIGMAAKTKIIDKRHEELTFVPIKEVPPDPKPIKPPPPPKLPPAPKIPPPVEPKIKLPDPPKMPDPPKPVEVKVPKPPAPVVVAAPPKLVVAAAAPKPVNVSLAQSASVRNNDRTPTAVALGTPDNPIAVSKSPNARAVALGNAGVNGMPPTNGGRGPAGPPNLGSGQPTGGINGTGVRAVAGVPRLGVTGGDPNSRGGNGVGNTPPRQVALGVQPVAPTAQPSVIKSTVKSPPTVTYKPTPVYTAEARDQHIEGTVRVHIHVTASGAVQVIGVTSGLGHGLDAAALQVCQGMRFKPALDAGGNPIDWDGNVAVSFQLA